MSIRSQNKIQIDEGSSSMTDLVFLLLIFFVILSTLAKDASDVNLPKGGQPAGENVKATKVEVYPDGTIKVNNKITAFDDIETSILNEINEKNNVDKAVELYGDINAQYKNIYEVIQIAKKNKLKVALMSN